MYDMLPLTKTLFRQGTHMYEDKETRRKRRRRRRKRKSRRKGRRKSKRSSYKKRYDNVLHVNLTPRTFKLKS